MVLAPMSNGYYDYRHQLLRDVLYRTIPTSERRRFHARAGEFGAHARGRLRDPRVASTTSGRAFAAQAFDAAVAGAREASLMYAHRESFELIAGRSRTCRTTSTRSSSAPSTRPIRMRPAPSTTARPPKPRRSGDGGLPRRWRAGQGAHRGDADLGPLASRSSFDRGPGRDSWSSSRPTSRPFRPVRTAMPRPPGSPRIRSMLELDSMDLAAARRRIERARADAVQGGDQEDDPWRGRQPGDARGPRGTLR